MKLPLLNAILTIKFGLACLGKCCFTYELPEQVLKEIGTTRAYDNYSLFSQCTTSASCKADVDDNKWLYVE